MIKVVLSFLILGIAILLVSAGLLALTEAQLDKRPVTPVSPLQIAEARNLGQIKRVSQVGITIGAVVIVLSATTTGVLHWRDR